MIPMDCDVDSGSPKTKPLSASPRKNSRANRDRVEECVRSDDVTVDALAATNKDEKSEQHETRR